MDAAVARQRLEGLLRDLDSSAETLDSTEAGDAGELGVVDPHSGEAASELTEHEREVALLSVVEQQRGEVQGALERLEAGSYGTCQDCGKPMTDERLDARPEAARCVECQTTMEHAR